MSQFLPSDLAGQKNRDGLRRLDLAVHGCNLLQSPPAVTGKKAKVLKHLAFSFAHAGAGTEGDQRLVTKTEQSADFSPELCSLR
jgi:hypothetical protein